MATPPAPIGPFEALTLEGRALEILTFILINEQIEGKNPRGTNSVTGSFEAEDKTFSGTFSIPASQEISGDGNLRIVATPNLVGAAISPATGGPTIQSTVPESYLLEVLMRLQAAERISAQNPQNRNAITGSYNSDTGVYQGTFTLPVALTLDGGRASFRAESYLVFSP